MRVCWIEVEQFRRFSKPMRLGGLESGLSVVYGANETGKSTVFLALKAVFFERHTSRSESIRRLRPYGGGSPRVTVEFVVDTQAYRLEKRFWHRDPQAVLSGPNGVMTGDAAEEALQALLGVDPAGPRGASVETMGVWGALWVQQRNSWSQMAWAEGLGRRSLAQSLEAEIGALSGVGDLRAVMAVCDQEIAGYLDGRGQPKGRHKDLVRAKTAAQEALGQLHARMQALATDVSSITTIDQDLAGIAAQWAQIEAVATHPELLKRAEQAQQIQARRQALMAQRDLAVRNVEVYQRHQDVATRHRAHWETVQKAYEALQEQQKKEETKRVRLQANVEALQHAAAQAIWNQTQAQDHYETLEAMAKAQQQAAVFQALRARAKAWQAATDQEQGPILLGPTELMVENALSAEHAILMAEKIAKAQAPKVTIDPKNTPIYFCSGTGSIQPAPAEIVLVEPVTLLLEDGARITITPSPEAINAKEAEQTARLELERCLQPWGVATVAELQACHQRWIQQQRTMAARREQHHRLQTDGGPTLEQIRAQLAAFPKPPVGGETVSASDIVAAQTGLSAVKYRSEQAAAALQTATAELAALDQELVLLASRQDGIEAELSRLDPPPIDPQAGAEPVLASRVLGAEQALQDLELSVQEGRSAQETLGQYRLDQERLLSQKDRLREQRAAALARVAHEDGQGIGERLERLAAHHATIVAELDVLQADLVAWQTLRQELQAQDADLRRNFHAPVIARMRPWLDRLFPGAVIGAHAGFQVVSLTRTEGQEPFEQMSVGTQEQIAVLTRVACAEMLIDHGHSVNVILDDALVYADTERRQQMMQLLQQAGQKMQILLLTCQSDLAQMGPAPPHNLEGVPAGE